MKNAARKALTAVLRSPYPTEVDGSLWRLALLWPRGTATVAYGDPVSTDYRVVHRARLAVVADHHDNTTTLAVRTYCGEIVVRPRTSREVEILTRANSVLDCVRCLRRATPNRRPPADAGTIRDPSTGAVLDVPLPGLDP